MSLPGRGYARVGYGLAEPEPLEQRHVGAAGTAAGRVAAGPGLFAVAWLDALYTLTPGEIADSVTLLDATP